MARHHRSFIPLLAALLALLPALLIPTGVLAGDPQRPLTSAERQAAEDRAGAARRLASDDGQASAVAGCPVPTGSGRTTQACPPPSGSLNVEARDQERSNYCGPAVGQVISNYSWAMGAGRNKWTQFQLGEWMGTNATGGTSAGGMATGLNRATDGSPREPANWVWVVAELRDSDGDRQEGDELHGFIRSNISSSRMPLAISVKPHEPGAQFHLSSGPLAKLSPGHWIAVYGWKHLYDGGDTARTYYTDSSKDEGGSTGKFSDPTRHIAEMIMVHTRRFVW
jgi:hypothetical protein